MADTSSLFSPVRIKHLEVKNRLVLGAASIASPHPNGTPSDESLAFYEKRCQGGVGLIITGVFMATTHGWNGAGNTSAYFRIDDDVYIESAKKIPEITHKYAVPVIAQLLISEGRMGKPGDYFSAASDVGLMIPEQALACILKVPGGVVKPAPRSSDLEEVRRLRDEMVESAVRCLKAGFDGIEIGAHMSYYLATFISKRTNLRTDEYGGSRENRARLVVELISSIRERTRKNFVIGIRMSANEHAQDGQGPEEYAALAKIFEEAGADYIALTDGAYESPDVGIDGNAALYRHGEAQLFKQNISIPIMLQSVHDPVLASRIIQEKQSDMIMLVRPLIADPYFPNKLKAGKLKDIVQCDMNNECFRRIMMSLPMSCPRNPEFGNEANKTKQGYDFKKWFENVQAKIMLQLAQSKILMKLASRVKK